MPFSRREFLKGGAAAFTIGFGAPGFLGDLARAQSAGAARQLVVLFLNGGNDSLSFLAPYGDPFYYSRRPTQAIPAANVLQLGTDISGKLLGLHPRLTGIRDLYNQGRVALIQRTGYKNQSRSHFLGTDIWATGNPLNATGEGWLGRYLEALPPEIDPLTAWNATGETPRALLCDIQVPAISNPRNYVYSIVNGGTEGAYERTAARRIVSHVPIGVPHVSLVTKSGANALDTVDRVGTVTTYTGTVVYPNTGFANTLKTVAGAIVRSLGTRIFWVQLGGFDTHANQATNAVTGSYPNLMGNLNDAIAAFCQDLANQGLLDSTMILQFSEFGRRINENGEGSTAGTDHGAATTMMAIGGGVRGGIYGTAANLQPFSGNPTLENNNNDLKFETDFRSVYARAIDQWFGANSVSLLGGDFRAGSPAFI